MSRRRFLASAAGAAGAGALASLAGPLAAAAPAAAPAGGVPTYLKDYAGLYATDPHAAALAWFRNAKFGLFIHYGLYSLCGGEWKGKPVSKRGGGEVAEWIQFHGLIPVAEYARLKDRFTAEKFDADVVTDLALAAEMKYVNLTTRHHDSFCLFRTKETDFNSVTGPAQRDLVGELADACRRKGLALFLYYSHGRDWRHPHCPPPSRPKYPNPQPEYVADDQVDLDRYLGFMTAQVTELLTQYGPVAGIWLDGLGIINGYGKRLGGIEKAIDLFKVHDLYAHIRRLQPNCLIAYKNGLTGTEDFNTPERQSFGLEKTGKPLEINTTIQAHSWGYNKVSTARKSLDELWETLATARKVGANLLLNTGPMGDGSIVPEEAERLRAMGKRIRDQGWPGAA
ncbi:MAG: alpha-L-fucosidase [Planctomycetes bacterium]|nr:alpha-L-fucosidase [Planctomycetota bacterium]